MRAVGVLVMVVVACGSGDRERGGAGGTEPPASGSASRVDEPVARPGPRGCTMCTGDDVRECLTDGSPGKVLRSCDGGCRAGACVETCALQDVELIYVVDENNNLSSFDPRKLPGPPFHLVGRLACEPSSRPFSMAVDRKGVAWVLYESGNVYRVSIIDASCSQLAYRAGPDAPALFGMGFVTDGANATAESLYVAANDDSRALARLDTGARPPRWQPIATLRAGQVRNPELTGTADGRLFGYFPEGGVGFVQEIDRQSGATVGRRLPLGTLAGETSHYAFAHWGGVFYVFATTDGNSAVHAVNRKTGAYQRVLDHLPQRIVGAGVSTCAPLLERLP
jgi:hypothetical protein